MCLYVGVFICNALLLHIGREFDAGGVSPLISFV